MIAELILLGTLTATSYRATPAQTKPECKSNSDCQTSIGENVNELGAAISQDLLASGRVRYHDVIYIDRIGYRIVFDTMHHRIHNAVDIFVYTRAEEKAFGVKHLRVWLVKPPQENKNR
jgi:3D (Asp-Asp-Asp) domain-containing protein